MAGLKIAVVMQLRNRGAHLKSNSDLRTLCPYLLLLLQHCVTRMRHTTRTFLIVRENFCVWGVQ